MHVIYIYIYTYVCTYKRTCIYIIILLLSDYSQHVRHLWQISVYICISVCIFINIYTYKHRYVYIHIYVYIYTYIYIYIHIYTYIYSIHFYIHTYIDIHINNICIYLLFRRFYSRWQWIIIIYTYGYLLYWGSTNIHMDICINICIHTYM
jgi:hypothetical protein